VGVLKRGRQLWMRASYPSHPCIGIDTCRWFRCAEKREREVDVIDPRGAAKQKEKMTPADVQTGGNKYSKAYRTNTVIATQLKFCAWNMLQFSGEYILYVYVHIPSRKLQILRQSASDWWLSDYQVTSRHLPAFISVPLIAILRRLSCCCQIIMP